MNSTSNSDDSSLALLPRGGPISFDPSPPPLPVSTAVMDSKRMPLAAPRRGAAAAASLRTFCCVCVL